MNKLLLSWCDNRRSWRLNPRGKDHNHFHKLYTDWAKSEDSKNSISSYLVINICYCIHEYRRMGLVPEGYQFTIPDIESLLRTVMVPLTPIFLFLTQQNISPENISFQYSRLTNKPFPNENDQTFLNRINNQENHRFTMSWNDNSREFGIISLADFAATSIAFLMDE